MGIVPEAAPAAMGMPRFEGGCTNMRGLIGQLTGSVADETMGAEAGQMRAASPNSRNGCRERRPKTRAGAIALGAPKPRSGSFFPDDAMERCQRAGRALVAAVAGTCATGASARRARRMAERMGVGRPSKDQAGAIAQGPDADVEEPLERDLSSPRTPCLWLDAACVRCRRGAHVASTAVVTAIGRGGRGWRHVPGASVAGDEPYDSRVAFLKGIRGRGAHGARPVTSDAHGGLRRAIPERFQGAAWQRCAVHLERDCVREAKARQLRGCVARIIAPISHAKDAEVVRAMHRLAPEMLGKCRPKAARIVGEAEPGALACLGFPASHWKRTRTSDAQERANRGTRRRSRVVQVFPSITSLERLAGAVTCDEGEPWSEPRYFAEPKMAELHNEGGIRRTTKKTPGQEDELRNIARKAMEASLELAGRLEAA